METCVIPTLLYGAENWILDEGCLEILAGIKNIKQKLSYFCKLLAYKDESVATRTIAGYNLSLVKHCIFLDSKLKTNSTAQILNGIDSASSSVRVMKKTINSSDRCLIMKEAGMHQPGLRDQLATSLGSSQGQRFILYKDLTVFLQAADFSRKNVPPV